MIEKTKTGFRVYLGEGFKPATKDTATIVKVINNKTGSVSFVSLKGK